MKKIDVLTLEFSGAIYDKQDEKYHCMRWEKAQVSIIVFYCIIVFLFANLLLTDLLPLKYTYKYPVSINQSSSKSYTTRILVRKLAGTCDGTISDYFRVITGVHRECVFAQIQFNTYMDHVVVRKLGMRNVVRNRLDSRKLPKFNLRHSSRWSKRRSR